MSRSALIYVLISISGASVLAVEILGTRILGPFYGVSLFLWSALITITLAALSVGYALGGRWADRGTSFAGLAFMLGGAGVWLLIAPWIKAPLLVALEPMELRPSVLVASTVLFFLPLTLLGMVGPYAIRLRASSLEVVGRTAGNIYAVSTMASVAGALLTGFVLIPKLGVSRLLLAIGVFLLAGALLALLAGRVRGKAAAAVLVLIAAGTTAAGMVPLDRARPEEGLLELRQSTYAELRVVDWEGARLLLLDGGSHTITQPGNWNSLHRYAVVLDVVKHLFSEPGRLGLVGLGGGSVVKSFDRSGWDIDVVEIDPEVAAVAREYFGLEDGDARVVILDGRRHFRTTDAAYDLVILDAFGSSAIPFHLVTRESFAEIKARMAPDGVLAMNVESDGWYDGLSRSLAATLRTSFTHVIALPTAEPETAFGNLLLLASDRDLEFDDAVLGNPYDYVEDPYYHWVVVERNHAWANRFEPPAEGGRILSDDRNRVDLWSESLNHKARKLLHADPPWKHLAY